MSKTVETRGVRRWVCVFLVLMGIAHITASQINTPKVRFRSLDLLQKEGPSTRKGIVQDPLGFVWISMSYGLVRYDGHEYKVFTPENYPEMINDQPERIYADSQNRIWITYKNGGIQYFSIEDQRFYDFIEEFANCLASVFYEDRQGNLWIDAANRPLSKVFPSEAGSIIEYSLSGEVKAMAEDSHGTIWLGTTKGLFKYLPEEDQVVAPQQALPYSVKTLKIGTDDKLWILTKEKGIVSYKEQGEGLKWLSDSEVQKWIDTDVTCLSIDHQNQVWAGTENGLYRYDPKSGAKEKYTYKRGDRFGLRDNFITTSTVTRNGSIWLEMHRGICIMDPNLSKFVHYHCQPEQEGFEHDHTNIFGLYVRDNGEIWSGSIGGGLLKYNPKTGEYRQFRQEEGNRNSLPSNVISQIWNNGDHFLWIRSRGGIARMDLRTEQVRDMDLKIKGKQVYYSAIGQDAKGYLWMGTHKDGVIKYDLKTESYQHFPLKIDFGDFYLDANGDFFCLADDGIYLLNEEGTEFIPLKSSDPQLIRKITNLVLSTDGKYWVGTERGLFQCKIDTKNHTIECVVKNLPAPLNKIIYCMVQDIRGHLWITGDMGLIRYVPATRSVIIYGMSDGLDQESFNLNAKYVDKQGDIYFGGVDGIYMFHPLTISENQVAPEVYITGLEVRDKKVRPGDEWGILEKDLLFSDEIEVPYHLNKIKLNVVGVNYTSPEEVHYKYRLSGFDTQWSEATPINQMTYTNLSPGTYTFEVVAANEDGLWSETPRKLTLEILPEYYQTWWFFVLEILAVIGVVLLLVRWWVKTLNKRHQLHNEMISSRQRALSAQMNPHFLFNCLISIQHFVLINKRDESSAFLIKFSQLIRKVFDSSSKSLVSIAEELKSLQLYLELEQLRSKNNFQFDIEIDEEIDTEFDRIPPLIIQPFVENAIWHGINDVEQGHISVKFQRKGKNILCTIEDNGIGRDAAVALKEQKRVEHKSGALRITRQRLDLISELTGQETGYTIVDLMDSSNKVHGTRVEITF